MLHRWEHGALTPSAFCLNTLVRGAGAGVTATRAARETEVVTRDPRPNGNSILQWLGHVTYTIADVTTAGLLELNRSRIVSVSAAPPVAQRARLLHASQFPQEQGGLPSRRRFGELLELAMQRIH